MKTVITHPTNTSVNVEFVLDKDELASARLVALRELGKETKVQGFRMGKAPIGVLSKQLNERDVQDKIVDVAVSKSIATYFIDNKVHALDRPSVSLKKYVPEESLEFTAEVEILPSVKLGDYKNLKSTVAPKKITKKDVDELISRMQDGFKEKSKVERSAKQGDEVVIDFVGKLDGAAFEGGTATDFKLVLGSNSFIDGFEQGIVDKKQGEKFDLDLKFPADYHAENLKDKKVVFETTLKEVYENKLPELNDEFAKKAGPFNNMEDLIKDVKRELVTMSEKDALGKAKDALVEELIEKTDIPTPQVLIDDQLLSIKQDFESNLRYQGLKFDDYLKQKKFDTEQDWIEKEAKPTAIRRVKAGLVLAELSREFNIEVSKEEIENHVNLYKSQYANNKEALEQFDNPSVINDITNRLITEKTVEKLLEINSKKN